MQVNPLLKEVFAAFPKAMKTVCEDKNMPWGGYAGDYNGPLNARASCSTFQQFKDEQIKITTQQKPPAKTGQPRPLGEAVTLAILSTIKGNQLLSSMLLSPKFCLMMLLKPLAWCIWTAPQAKHKNCEHVRK